LELHCFSRLQEPQLLDNSSLRGGCLVCFQSASTRVLPWPLRCSFCPCSPSNRVVSESFRGRSSQVLGCLRFGAGEAWLEAAPLHRLWNFSIRGNLAENHPALDQSKQRRNTPLRSQGLQRGILNQFHQHSGVLSNARASRCSEEQTCSGCSGGSLRLCLLGYVPSRQGL
jgi:hypothetical protein